MIQEIKVGPLNIADGMVVTPRAARTGELVITDANGRAYEASSRGTVFSSSITGQITTVGLATTYTGLVLSNPIGSGAFLSVLKAGWAFLVAFPAASLIGLMTGFSSSTNTVNTTPALTRSQKINGGGTSYGVCASSATLGATPVVNTVLGAGLTAAITTSPTGMGGLIDLGGSIILAPGAFVAFYTSTISGAAAGAFSFEWQEIDALPV